MSEITTRDQVRNAYDEPGSKYDQVRFDTARGALLTEHDLALFRRYLPEVPGDARVVEVGAGTGRFTLAALERGIRIEATDVNESLLAELAQKLADRGLTDRCAVRREDIFALGIEDESVDLVYGIHVIPRFQSLEDQRLALREVARTLRPGGRLFFNFRNGASLLYGRVDKEHAAKASEIEEILDDLSLSVDALHGKWILNGRLVDLVGAGIGRAIAAVDRALWSFQPRRAWDVFVLATKR